MPKGKSLISEVTQFIKEAMHVITTNQNTSIVSKLVKDFIEQGVEFLSENNKKLIRLYDNSPVKAGWNSNFPTIITSYKNMLQN